MRVGLRGLRPAPVAEGDQAPHGGGDGGGAQVGHGLLGDVGAGPVVDDPPAQGVGQVAPPRALVGPDQLPGHLRGGACRAPGADGRLQGHLEGPDCLPPVPRLQVALGQRLVDPRLPGGRPAPLHHGRRPAQLGPALLDPPFRQGQAGGPQERHVRHRRRSRPPGAPRPRTADTRRSPPPRPCAPPGPGPGAAAPPGAGGAGGGPAGSGARRPPPPRSPRPPPRLRPPAAPPPPPRRCRGARAGGARSPPAPAGSSRPGGGPGPAGGRSPPEPDRARAAETLPESAGERRRRRLRAGGPRPGRLESWAGA